MRDLRGSGEGVGEGALRLIFGAGAVFFARRMAWDLLFLVFLISLLLSFARNFFFFEPFALLSRGVC